MDEAKLEEYINLCTPSFLIKMKTTNDKSYFFKAHKSDYKKETSVLKFTIANIDTVSDDKTQYYREIDLKVFGKDFKKLKATIIPEHKDMYKDIVTEKMEVDCDKDTCGGNVLETADVIPPPPLSKRKPNSIQKVNLGLKGKKSGIKNVAQAASIVEYIKKKNKEKAALDNVDENWQDQMETLAGGRKKKKKRRKKSSRSKKRRNKRKNRTKKN